MDEGPASDRQGSKATTGDQTSNRLPGRLPNARSLGLGNPVFGCHR